jgi:hypothetical protein
MSKTMVVLMKHKLTLEQEFYARENMGVTEFVYPPDEILEFWRYITIHACMEDIHDFFVPIYFWLSDVFSSHKIILGDGEPLLVTEWLIVSNRSLP